MKKQIAIEIICFLFILLFVYAALVKIMDVEKFQVQLGQSPVLMAFAGSISWSIPFIEFVIAVMLIFSRFRLVGLYASFTLMAMFTTYVAVILIYASHVPCACGGILDDMGWTEHLIFNIAFVVLAALGVGLWTRQRQEEKIKSYND